MEGGGTQDRVPQHHLLRRGLDWPGGKAPGGGGASPAARPVPSRPLPVPTHRSQPRRAQRPRGRSSAPRGRRDRCGSPPHRHLDPQHETLRGRPPSCVGASPCPSVRPRPAQPFRPPPAPDMLLCGAVSVPPCDASGVGGNVLGLETFLLSPQLLSSPKLSRTTVILMSNIVFPLTFRPVPVISHFFYFKMKPMYQ